MKLYAAYIITLLIVFDLQVMTESFQLLPATPYKTFGSDS